MKLYSRLKLKLQSVEPKEEAPQMQMAEEKPQNVITECFCGDVITKSQNHSRPLKTVRNIK